MPFCALICRSLINRVNVLEAKLSQMENRLATLQNSNAMAIDPYVTVQTAGTPKVVFSGVNVQIVNGLGRTDSINGLGNLIIGYDKERSPVSPAFQECSIGGTVTWANDINYNSQLCTAAGGVMATNHKNGSHYLIVGDEHNYSQYSGVVFGHRNTSNRAWATVTGGHQNHAGGEAASVSGGQRGLAQGTWSSITGGLLNYADGAGSSVNGGERNAATARAGASICGGVQNAASGDYSHVSGGMNNAAQFGISSILGGTSQSSTTVGQTIPALP